jgi:hypothetical protein
MISEAPLTISEDLRIKAIGERWDMRVTSMDDLPIPQELISPPLLAQMEDDANSDIEPLPSREV